MWLSLMWPSLGTWSATQACVLTGNQTGDPLVCMASTQSTEPHEPGWDTHFNLSFTSSYHIVISNRGINMQKAEGVQIVLSQLLDNS